MCVCIIDIHKKISCEKELFVWLKYAECVNSLAGHTIWGMPDRHAWWGMPHSVWQEKLACQAAWHLMKIRLGMPDRRVGLMGVRRSSGTPERLNRHQLSALPSRRILCDLPLTILFTTIVFFNVFYAISCVNVCCLHHHYIILLIYLNVYFIELFIYYILYTLLIAFKML